MTEVITVITFFISMEGVAWITHKYIMHGLLWSLHKDHHRREYEGFFEKNDFFFLFFAVPGIICLIAGLPHFTSVFFAGIGKWEDLLAESGDTWQPASLIDMG